jgi:hypothetical protein
MYYAIAAHFLQLRKKRKAYRHRQSIAEYNPQAINDPSSLTAQPTVLSQEYKLH